MNHFTSQVIDLVNVAKDYYVLRFTWDIEKEPLPGQFITIKTTTLSSPLLRRPFAISSYIESKKIAEIVFQKIGEGTKLMCQLKVGDELDILGPLGNSFVDYVNRDKSKEMDHILIAGGIGTGPMLFLADQFFEMNLSPILVIGCKNKSFIPFKALDERIKTVICTDDGSHGFHGNVVDFLKNREVQKHKTTFYSCGPEPMLKSCSLYAKSINMDSIVSLEQMMACGVGACMGCTCETEGMSKFARVCKDGPIFKASEVKWT